MQTVKTGLFVLFCVVFLSACGLKGPLYLEAENPVLNPVSEQQATADKETEDDSNKTKKKKSSSR